MFHDASMPAWMTHDKGTLLRSYKIVIDYLNKVGLAVRDPFDYPTRSALR